MTHLDLLTLKTIGALAIMAGGAVQLAWAAATHFARRSLSPAFYRFALTLHAVIFVQVLLGLILWLTGWPVPGMHLFYALLTTAGALAILALRPKTEAGQRYRGRPLVHAALGLFVLLVALRAWMSAN